MVLDLGTREKKGGETSSAAPQAADVR